MFRKSIFTVGLFLVATLSCFSKEGMWIPSLLNKYNIQEMQKMGFRLTADDIYSINHESMKDAVVLFGSGCTGELISDQGLLITNHHCGLDQIQNHSSIEHDYLTDGFWAKSREEELPNPGLSVRFLDRLDEVTSQVLAGTEGQPADSVTAIVARNSKRIGREAAQNGKYEATVQPLFYGNQYYLYVYQVFDDVRLVGAPPSSIGKFGGDTDNWMWPRHTGDFSVFRIYAGKNNQPAKYSADNVPFKPRKFFKISLNGVKPGEFTMVFGYPGRTQQFLPSQAIQQIVEQGDPDKIKIRDLKLGLLNADMEKDPKIRIQYTAKYQSTSNAWKKWQGELKGLNRLKAIDSKQKNENYFMQWVQTEPERQKKYGEILPAFEKLYLEQSKLSKAYDYYSEIVQRGTDIFNLVGFFELIESKWNSLSANEQQKLVKTIAPKLAEYFNEYNQSTDEKIFCALLKTYANDLNPDFLPESFKTLMNKEDQDAQLLKVYRKSIFTKPDQLTLLVSELNGKKLEKLSNDPAFSLFRSLKKHFQTKVEAEYNTIQKEIDQKMKTYVAGIMEMKNGASLWADANKTLRVAYGQVEGYEPMDGVSYNYFTTLDGIIQKHNPDVYDYQVPQELKNLYLKNDFGKYGENGKMPVCFIASNHTTGGNSGSPVLNADGKLIGINFDRCWEGTMSDLMFDPDRCRNIVLDIRYVLFIVDKFAGASYLLNEMVIEE
jgi:hypothetical protein